jgi:nucleotidyltransferase/DNA polymerase involved in DNA repair
LFDIVIEQTFDISSGVSLVVGCILLPRFCAEVEDRALGISPFVILSGAERREESRHSPVIAVHHRGRLLSISPQAEEAGLSVGMRLREAQAVCPEAEFTPFVEEHYHEPWHEVLDVCAAYSSTVEPVCLGEVFFELPDPSEQVGAPGGGCLTNDVILNGAKRSEESAVCRGFSCGANGRGNSRFFASLRMTPLGRRLPSLHHAPPAGLQESIGHSPLQPIEIQEAIHRQTGFTCSAGAGSSKLVARIAAQVEPGRVVAPQQGAEFLAPLPIEHLWPLDEKTRQSLRTLGISTIGLLQQVPVSRLQIHFGRDAQRLLNLALGVDNSPVHPLYPSRTIEARLSLPDAIDDSQRLEACLRKLSAEIAEQLQRRRETCGRIAMRVEVENQVPRAPRPRGQARTPVLPSPMGKGSEGPNTRRAVAFPAAYPARPPWGHGGPDTKPSAPASGFVFGPSTGKDAALLGVLSPPQDVGKAEPDREGDREVGLRPRTPAFTEEDIFLACRLLLKRMELTAPVTAIVVQASDFHRQSAAQLGLFEAGRARPSVRRRARETLASAQERFGSQAVMLGADIEVPRRERMLAAVAGGAS